MGVTCFLLLSLGLAITAQGQSCSKPVGGPNMSLKDEFILLETFDDGSRVSFACNVGYAFAGGSSVITCTAGSWSPVRLQCQRKNCGSPGEMEHGQIDFSEGTEFGAKIVITCDEGYKFVGRQDPREIFCGDQGWDDRFPVCEAVTCYLPNTPPDVTLSPLKESYGYGEVVRYKCLDGLSLDGSNSASCSNDGTFIPDPPTCVTMTCAPPNTLAHMTLSPIKESYSYGDVVQYSCPKDFTLIASESCSSDGTFKPDPPKCIKIQCEDDEIPNGEKVGVSKPTYGYQETVTFKCNVGYMMRGESTVTCDMNSQWSPKLPECELVTCKPPEIVANGMFSPVQDSYRVGEVVE